MFLLQKACANQITPAFHLYHAFFLSLPTPHVWFFREKHHN